MAITLDFDKMQGLVPAIVQDADTGQVLMLGYMNEQALRRTEQEGRVVFFSRSKQRLWVKGESSGNVLHVVELHADCDADALLVRARPAGPTCHRGTVSCFDSADASESSAPPVGFLATLERVIRRRHQHPDEEPNSYTASLFRRGLPKIAQKVGEEAVETVIDAVAGNRAGLAGEAADLLFHLLVLLRASGLSLAEVLAVLRERHASMAAGTRRAP